MAGKLVPLSSRALLVIACQLSEGFSKGVPPPTGQDGAPGNASLANRTGSVGLLGHTKHLIETGSTKGVLTGRHGGLVEEAQTGSNCMHGIRDHGEAEGYQMAHESSCPSL